MARRKIEVRNLSRGKPHKKPKLTIYAYCEGKNSEPDYLTAFCRINGNGMVHVTSLKAQGVPKTIVNRCILKKDELVESYKKSKDPLDNKYEIWAVFDCDEHPCINESFQRADSKGIYVAYSNPCFELWALLHIRSQEANIHRHDLQSVLAKELSGYDIKSKKICAVLLNNNYDEAKERAINLSKRHEAVGSPFANPYTDIYKLLDKIIANGKIHNQKL